jgi:hypothetical protein
MQGSERMKVRQESSLSMHLSVPLVLLAKRRMRLVRLSLRRTSAQVRWLRLCSGERRSAPNWAQCAYQ